MPRLTKKMFREHLNARYPVPEARGTVNAAGPVYGPTKRPYGDYLYAQDRDKFDLEFEEWKVEKAKDAHA